MRLLLLDIETAPLSVFSWGLWDQNIAINQIIEPGYTLCWAAKWYKSREVLFDSIHDSRPKQMFKKIHKLVDEADAVVHYNGTRFDMPTLNTGFLEHGLHPPSNYADIDLLKTARQKFKFPSNKLDYVSQELGLGQKLKHKGMDLWRGCMAGNDADWRVMKRYNIQDVKLLEKVYVRLLPWIEGHPNWGLFVDAEDPVCRNCGSKNVQKNGVRRTSTMTYHRYRCNDCGKSCRGRRKKVSPGEGVLV